MDKRLKIYCWGESAGTLLWSEREATSIFTYDRDFLEKGYDLFPLLCPIRNASGAVSYIGRPQPGTKEDGLPPFIADFLPDDWGSLLFADWAREHHLNAERISRLEKLSYIGRRAPGALEFVPEVRFPKDKKDLRLAEILSLARRISAQRESLKILPGESKTLQRLFELGSSAGGRRPKAFVAINRDTGEIRSGQTLHDGHYDYYILKIDDDGTIPFNRLEMTYYEMAREAGLNMMPSSMMDVDGAKCFLTKRFDREDGKKIHTQTLAAMRPSADSYGRLMETCRMLGLPAEDLESVFRQAVFNVFSGNTDDHARNFEFLLPQGGRWRLSPPYDINYIIHGMDESARGRHCLPVSGKLDGITENDLLALARDNSIRKPRETIEKTCNAITTFREKAKGNGVPGYWVDRIEKDLYGLLPERFKDKVNRWSLARTDLTVDGVAARDIHFEMTAGGDFKFSADIDGIHVRHVFSGKRPECRDIIERGGDNMPEKDKASFVKTYLLPVAVKAAGGLNPAQWRHFEELILYGFPYGDVFELAKNGRARVSADIYHTPALSPDSSDNDDKARRKADVILVYREGDIHILDPVKEKDLGTASAVLRSQQKLSFPKQPDPFADNRSADISKEKTPSHS